MEWFVVWMVVIFSFHKLNFPSVLDVELYKITSKEIIEATGKAILVVFFIRLLRRFIDFVALALLLLAFFIITAMPPSGMFISEFMIFQSVFEAGNLWLLVLIFLLLTLIIWSQAKNFLKILFIKSVGFKEDNIVKINPVESVSQFILLGLVIYLGLNPPAALINLINESIQNLPH